MERRLQIVENAPDFTFSLPIQRGVQLRAPRASRVTEWHSAQRRCSSAAMPCWVVSGSESQTHRSKYGVPLEAWGADPPLRGAPTWGRFSWRRPPGPVAPDRSLPPRTGGTGTAPAARRAPSPRQETELATSTAWAVVPHSQFPEVSRANSASVDAMVPRGCRRSTGVFMKSAGAGATALGGGTGWNRPEEEYSVVLTKTE